MKILVINNTVGKRDPSFVIRNEIPSLWLRKLGHQVDFLPIQTFDYDIVVFNRFYAVNFPEILEIARKLGAKIVYETDDLVIQIEKRNPAKYEVKDQVKTAYQLLRDADLITCSTEYLKSELSKLTSKPIQVVPNALDMSVWRVRAGNNKKLRIGFAGSITHFVDLDFVLDVILELAKRYDFEFITFGLGLSKELKELSKVEGNEEWVSAAKSSYKKLQNLKNFIYEPWCSVDEYPKKLTELNLDIGLAPLLDSKFSRCKSCIKFYEYAAVGTTTIASNVIPYNQEVNYLAKNKFIAWKNKLEKLILDIKLRESLLKEQRDWVLQNRDIAKVVYLWEKTFKEIL